tara:strand:- start:1243 stop:2022 length:780 start_codon:yes stop_codon:yes gene_type:complete
MQTVDLYTLVITDEHATTFVASTVANQTGRSNRLTTGLALKREVSAPHGYTDIVGTSPGNATGIRWWVMWCGRMQELDNPNTNPLPNVPGVATRLSKNNSPLLPLATIVHVKNSLQKFMEITNATPSPNFPAKRTMFEIDPAHALECPLYSRLCFTIEGGSDSVYGAQEDKYKDKFICLYASDFSPFEDTFHMYKCTNGRTVTCTKVDREEDNPDHNQLQDAIEEQIAFTGDIDAHMFYNTIQEETLWDEGIVSLDHHS